MVETLTDEARKQLIKNGVAKLRNTFGKFVNEDVLAAVLEMFNVNVAEASKFLEGSDDQGTALNLYNYDPNNAATHPSTLPPGYMDADPALIARATKPSSADEPNVDIPIARLKRLFIETSTYGEHLTAARNDFPAYFACLAHLLRLSVDIKGNAPRALAALWATHRFAAADVLLQTTFFGLPEVLRALSILDTPRRIRALEKRMSRLQRHGNVRPITLKRLTSTLNDLKREPVEAGSVSGALARRLRKWVASVPEKQLLFFCLQLPKEPWKQLADLIHINPTEGLRAPWFLKYAFGLPLPFNEPVAKAMELAPENLFETVQKLQLPYAYLRTQKSKINDGIRALVATYEKLDTLVWWYEELRCPAVDEILRARLAAANVEVALGYGHLLDRLLAMRAMNSPVFESLIPLVEKRLSSYKLSMKAPVVCFGDASGSMDVAIRVATVVASFLTALVSADLCFFKNQVSAPAVVPRSIGDVLRVTMETRADGGTSPAAALWPYYANKIPVETFIVVTDEQENVAHNGFYFAPLFVKYHSEVHPANLIFVSFLDDPQRPGQMTQALAPFNIRPLAQVVLAARRPDLSKLDSLLGLLSLQSSAFINDWESLKTAIATLPELTTPALEQTLANASVVLPRNQDLIN